jgi:EAL domain-containing protein (putative c-di-GMP-specific phosphodiesterase class I)
MGTNGPFTMRGSVVTLCHQGEALIRWSYWSLRQRGATAKPAPVSVTVRAVSTADGSHVTVRENTSSDSTSADVALDDRGAISAPARTVLAAVTAVAIVAVVGIVGWLSLPPAALAATCAVGATVFLDRIERRRGSRHRHPTSGTILPPLSEELSRSIEQGQLVLHYQPKADLETGAVTGAEALVRWNHPTLGMLAPDDFIPLAEENGFIAELGAWVLAEACAQTMRWEGLLSRDFTMSVNLSPRQFQLHEVDDVVVATLRSSGLAPSRLELELTEGQALHQRNHVNRSLSRLVELGVRCSIDDFGTGYSGLSHLSDLPVTGLKIDKSFVQAIDSTTDRAPIIRAVVALAADLSLDVVAEGVETQHQLEFLRRNGCHEAQGFHLGRPVPADQFEILLLLDRSTRSAAHDRLAERA